MEIKISKNILSIPTGLTVVVHRADSGPWVHGTIVMHGTGDDNGRCYKVGTTKTGCIITRLKRHMKASPLSADTMLDAYTIQPSRDLNLEHSETIKQKSNRRKDMQGSYKHIIKKLLP